jgi:WD40 repeat protein
MGNKCAKGSDVAENRRAEDEVEEPPKRDKKTPHSKSGKSTPSPKLASRSASPPPVTTQHKNDAEDAASAGLHDTVVMSNIEALQHTLKPTVSVIPTALRHSEFRQFTSIFAQNKAALAVASCSRAKQPLHVLAAGEDRCIALLNYETGHVMRRWVHAHHDDINCITTPTTSGHFATASRDKMVRVWDFTSESWVAQLEGHTLNVTSADMSADASLIVSGSKDNTVRLWDVARAEELYCGDVKLNVVHFVKFMPSVQCVAQGGEDLAVRLWDVRTQNSHCDLQLSKTIEGMDYYPVCCETVPDNTNILLTGHNGVNGCGSYVAEWDIRTGKRLATYEGHKATVSNVKMVAPRVYGDGTFFSASDDGTFGVWNREDGERTGEVHLAVEHQFRFPEGRITCFDAEENGDTVVSTDDGCLVVLRPVAKDGAVVPSFRLRYVGALKPRV